MSPNVSPVRSLLLKPLAFERRLSEWSPPEKPVRLLHVDQKYIVHGGSLSDLTTLRLRLSSEFGSASSGVLTPGTGLKGPGCRFAGGGELSSTLLRREIEQGPQHPGNGMVGSFFVVGAIQDDVNLEPSALSS